MHRLAAEEEGTVGQPAMRRIAGPDFSVEYATPVGGVGSTDSLGPEARRELEAAGLLVTGPLLA
jgi:hypothetical protein